MKTTTKRISLLFWLTIVALHLLVSALPAPGTCAPKLNNADWQILPLSQSSRVKGARLTELQTGSLINASHGVLVVAQSGLSNPVIGLVRMLPAPESGAMVPQNVFAYQPGPRGFVIQQDGPLVTGNQAAVAQGDLSGVINDPAQMLPAPRPGSFNPDLPGAPIVSFEVGDGGLFLPAARAHGPNPYGSFLSLDPITNQAYVRGRLANLPQWNPATQVSDAYVPPGVQVQLSIANPHPDLPGSGYGLQLRILNDADKARIIYSNTQPLPPK